MRKLLIFAAGVVALSAFTTTAFAGCITGPTPETTECSDAQIGAMQSQYQPNWWKARHAQPSSDERYRDAVRAEMLRERAVTFDAAIAGQMADEEAARQAQAQKRYFVQGLVGAIVAPLAQAGADRLSGYGGRGYYSYGSYGRGGGYPGTSYGDGRDPGRQTQPIRVYCNPRAGQYCPY